MKSAKDTPSNLLGSREAFVRHVAVLADQINPSFAILLVGLDRFKALNETLGPIVADQLLDVVGKRLHWALREHDRLLRMPGDEFAILLNPAKSADVTNEVGERLANLLQRAFLVSGQVVHLSASIGIARAPECGVDGGALLKRAGIALQSGKAVGTGSVSLFEPAMEDRLFTRHALITDLRRALLLRQLEVFYQPQIELASEKLIGFEALLRWHHPELGWISPARFIPLAEENGLIESIGEWVLRTACQRAATLPGGVVMAVNASPLQFRSKSYFKLIENALSLSNLPPNRLEIEITEGVLLQNGDEVMTTLHDLRSMGVRLAMDDFGTGYSSLGQLSKLPFDTIKIDRSLIGGSEKQRPIVRAIAMLGSALGMSTLAEGIETEEQLTNTRSDGCTSAQGYLFGKATPATQLPEVLARFSGQQSTRAGILEKVEL